jgi:hypothetical protein
LATTDQTALPLAEILLACLAAEVDQLADPPTHVCLRVGATVDPQLSTYVDECCDGVAWVRVDTVYPSDSFPAKNTVPSPCGPLGYAVVLEMGVVRCAPTPDAEEVITCEEWTALADAVLADAAAMRRAVCCFVAADTNVDRLVVEDGWTPLPTQANCAGGTLRLTVEAGPCDC